MNSTFDFVIVGAGPAGCALAAQLCSAAGKPAVLLLEAGGENADIHMRVDGKRWLTKSMDENLNWGYKTVPQKNCFDREFDYSRGRGLGGTSAINFSCFTIGARDDFEEWARLTGDESFNWTNMQRRFKGLESFDCRIPVGLSKYAAPDSGRHGQSGKLGVSYAPEWERDLYQGMDAMEKAGYPINVDHNSGNPIGMSVLINSSKDGVRSTAKDLITPKPNNLTIITDSLVTRLTFDGKHVTGVESNGKVYHASKEVILCAGALNTPGILMHSGIGDPEELMKFNIPVVSPIKAVGKGLRDHFFCPIVNIRTKGSTERPGFYGSKQAMDNADKHWDIDKTGPWTKFGCELGMGWFKLDNLEEFPEFCKLPKEEKELLLKETIPHYEVVTHFPIHLAIPDFPADSLDYSCYLVYLLCPQSRGEVTLQSSDPRVPLRFDPHTFESKFDCRMAVEALRDVLRVTKHPSVAGDVVAPMFAPKSETDEDLLCYWRKNVSSSWHMASTAKMGHANDEDAVVDSSFRLGGISGLRVADMSVVPVNISGHPQVAAYLVGMVCGEKLLEEYKLDRG
ncbi:glucose-methanol-choline oxidoreductase [Cladochytrium replicatum]|nr:glucose-methanol-choline oxidoreductase [Cladochytrium replicatum]